MTSQWRRRFDETPPFKIEGVYCKLIPLTKGQYAIVDATDYEWLMCRRWGAKWDGTIRSFYAVRKEGGRRIFMHRQILGLHYRDGVVSDHISTGDTLDNRRLNLRAATKGQSARNKRRYRSNTSGFKGVCRRRDKWVAAIRLDGKRRHLGTFATPEAAHVAYREAVSRDHGEFGRAA